MGLLIFYKTLFDSYSITINYKHRLLLIRKFFYNIKEVLFSINLFPDLCITYIT